MSVVTLGCRVNQYETDVLVDSLKRRGVDIVPFGERCDITVVNTCTVTAESDRKSRQTIRRAASFAKHTVVTGCFAQISADYLATLDKITFACGNSGKAMLADTVYQILEGKHSGEKVNITPPDDIGAVKMTLGTPTRTRPYIKIEDGCNNRCSYCIISSARGPVRSKPPALVIEEATALAQSGYREVILTGIETASYGADFESRRPYGHSLADLLREISKIDGIERIGLGSLEPTVMTDYFTDAVRALPKVLPHFHLSIQSGSSKILATMRRRYNAEMALSAIERMRKAVPAATFSADVIVGFPGETDGNFKETAEFCRAAKFLHLHIFPYSVRQGTEAAEMKEQVPEQIKHARLAELEGVGKEIKEKLLTDYVTSHRNSPVQVLAEKSKNGRTFGHSEHFVEVYVDGISADAGTIIPVLLDRTDGNTCIGHAFLPAASLPTDTATPCKRGQNNR